MPTFIELHLLTFFVITILIELSIKHFFQTKSKFWAIFLCAILFAVIKFLMDYFCTNIFSQAVVIFFYFVCSNIVVHKFLHISKLALSLIVGAFYFCLALGLQIVFSKFLSYQVVYQMSNFYLLTLLGFCMICFWLFDLVRAYAIINKSLRLTKLASLQIGEQNIALNGFVDTGNNLVDPKSKLCVVIVNIAAIKKHISTKEYADILFCTNSSEIFDDIHKIKYATISGTDFITVFRPSKFVVDGKNVNCMVGISFAQEVGQYQAIMPAICS